MSPPLSPSLAAAELGVVTVLIRCCHRYGQDGFLPATMAELAELAGVNINNCRARVIPRLIERGITTREKGFGRQHRWRLVYDHSHGHYRLPLGFFDASHEARKGALAVAAFASWDDPNRPCWVTPKKMAAEHGVTTATIKTWLDAAADEGLISVTRPHRRAPRIRFLFGPPVEHDRSTEQVIGSMPGRATAEEEARDHFDAKARDHFDASEQESFERETQLQNPPTPRVTETEPYSNTEGGRDRIHHRGGCRAQDLDQLRALIAKLDPSWPWRTILEARGLIVEASEPCIARAATAIANAIAVGWSVDDLARVLDLEDGIDNARSPWALMAYRIRELASGERWRDRTSPPSDDLGIWLESSHRDEPARPQPPVFIVPDLAAEVPDDTVATHLTAARSALNHLQRPDLAAEVPVDTVATHLTAQADMLARMAVLEGVD